MLAAAVVVWLRDPASERRREFALLWLALVLPASFVLILPFVLNFNPEARGVGGGARPAAVRRSGSATWR